jgi:hypothetical protein
MDCRRKEHLESKGPTQYCQKARFDFWHKPAKAFLDLLLFYFQAPEA